MIASTRSLVTFRRSVYEDERFMTKDATPPLTVLDENQRRYYLDVMGVQCWQLLDTGNQQAIDQDTGQAIDEIKVDTDVASDQLASNNINWPQLDNAIQQCTKCQLHKTRKQAVSGKGSQSAELMFVLLSPGMDEASGLLTAEANALFSKMLSAINVSIDDVYITSLLKCAVPAQHTVSPHEIQQCNDYLRQQVRLIQPKRLIVLGETAIRCMLQKNSTLDDFRELINSDTHAEALSVNTFESLPLFVSYSPQELLQQPENKRKAWSDLQQLQKIIQI